MDSVPDPFYLDTNRTIDLAEDAVGDNVTRTNDCTSTQVVLLEHLIVMLPAPRACRGQWQGSRC